MMFKLMIDGDGNFETLALAKNCGFTLETTRFYTPNMGMSGKSVLQPVPELWLDTPRKSGKNSSGGSRKATGNIFIWQ